MVGPNTMLASSQWIKKNMMGVYSEQLGRPLTEPEIRVQRSTEQLIVPDWYRKYSKPSVKFLKNDTPIEFRQPSWRTVRAKTRSPRKTQVVAKLSSTFNKPQPPSQPPPQPPPLPPQPEKTSKAASPRKSLNSNYRIARKADNLRSDNRLSISISPCSSDNESAASKPAANLSLSMSKLRSPLNNSHTFPRVHPSRKIQNINIVFPKDFTPKPAQRASPEVTPAKKPEPKQQANSSALSTSTPRTQYTLTKSIQLQEPEFDDSHSDTLSAQSQTAQRSHTSFLFAEVEPGGVLSSTLTVFAGMDSSTEEDDDDHSEPEQQEYRQELENEQRPCDSPHTRFFNSQNKSSELERIVQSKRSQKRQDSLIREIIGELDRSIAESSTRQNSSHSAEANSSGSEFVRSIVRALENESYRAESSDIDDDRDQDSDRYSSDSDLAKSTSISFKSYDDIASSLDEDESSPPSSPDCYPEEQHEPEIYWIPTKIHELPRTSSRLSVLSRGSSRSGFQCTSGRCSPGLSPIKSDRRREEWTASLASSHSQKTSRQLFRIDESTSQMLPVDSGCYSDRSRSAATASRTPNYAEAAPCYSPPLSSLSSSPTLEDFNGITSDMLVHICGPQAAYPAQKSIRV